MRVTLEVVKELNSYLKSFERTRFENEHLFGVWHGFAAAYEVIMGRDPGKIEIPEWPEEWDYQRRAKAENKDG